MFRLCLGMLRFGGRRAYVQKGQLGWGGWGRGGGGGGVGAGLFVGAGEVNMRSGRM